MMAEKKLGKSWRELLAEHVLKPLALGRTSASLEDFAPGEPARCHTRAAPGAAWEAVPPKPTPLLNAAGGIYVSGNDAAAFLKAFTSEGRSAGARIPAAALSRTGEVFSTQDRMTWGFHRRHYGLGWDISTYGSRPVWLRGGVYTGCRAMYLVYPEAKLAIGVLTVSDIAGHTYNAAIVQQAIDFWMDDPAAETNAERRVADFSREAAAAVLQLQKARAAAAKPLPIADVAAYRGRYASDRLGTFTVTIDGAQLRAGIGELRLALVPVGGDKFLGFAPADPQPESFSFERGSDGHVVRLVWGERAFERLP
jgi:CubicO group peptidase (beta-lactamase class C family)